MKKKVLLLAVSCKNGGLCPGGIDMDNPSRWIRIVEDDGHGGSVQGYEIDFANPLDIIEFDGHPMPQGKQKENWVIDNDSCKKTGSKGIDVLDWAYKQYSYNGFWNNRLYFLDEEEYAAVTEPSESIMKVSKVKIYRNWWGKQKVNFNWCDPQCKSSWISKIFVKHRIHSVAMTDLEFLNRTNRHKRVRLKNAFIIVAIPKYIDDWVNPINGNKKAYKIVSKIYSI